MQSPIVASRLFPLLSSHYSSKHRSVSTQKLTEIIDPLIVPKVQVFSGQGIHLETNIQAMQGKVLDFCGQTVTYILGQNDPWVTSNIIAYMLSGKPSFLSTTMGQDIYYTLPRRVLEISKMGKDCFVNHRLNNGSDAIDFATNISYLYHRNIERKTLLAFKGSYHGQGHLLYAMSDLETYRSFFGNISVKFLETPSHTSDIKHDTLSSHDEKIIEKIKEMGGEGVCSYY